MRSENIELYQKIEEIAKQVKEKGKATKKDDEDAIKLFTEFVDANDVELEDKIKLAFKLQYKAGMHILSKRFSSFEQSDQKRLVEIIISSDEFNAKTDSALERAIGLWCEVTKEHNVNDITGKLLKHILVKSKNKKTGEYKETVISWFNKYLFNSRFDMLNNISPVSTLLEKDYLVDLLCIFIKSIEKLNDMQKKQIFACWVDSTFKDIRSGNSVSKTIDEWLLLDDVIFNGKEADNQETNLSSKEEIVKRDTPSINAKREEKKLKDKSEDHEREIRILTTKINDLEHKEKEWQKDEKELRVRITNLSEQINALSMALENKDKLIQSIEDMNKELGRALTEYQGLLNKNENNSIESFKNEISRSLRNDYRDFLENRNVQNHNELGEMYYFQLDKIFRAMLRLGIKLDI
ncbi:MAG TPA: hypothetical protein VEF53_20045 [Patescibacteria group bacterium]|nr:hypothetical protein [Patescibacteria group bacterium]